MYQKEEHLLAVITNRSTWWVLFDKWFVQTGVSTYRTSPDTINWNENNSMTISDGKGVIADDTAFRLDTSYREEHIVEHNKKLYALATTASTKPFLVSTTDLITWELVLPTNHDTSHNTELGYNSPVKDCYRN